MFLISENTLQAKCLLEVLDQAATASERLSVLKIMSISFDHSIQIAHDEEIQAGADVILCKSLHRALRGSDSSKESERICKVLSMTYQCSDSVAIASLHGIATDLVPMILQPLWIDGSMSKPSIYTSQLVHRIASIQLSLPSMTNREKLLTFLIRAIRTSLHSNDEMCKLSLCLLNGLTTHNDSMMVAMQYPGLFDVTIDVASMSMNPAVQMEAAQLLHNLAWDVRNRVLLGRNARCLDVLIEFSEVPCCRIRLQALRTLRRLSSEVCNKIQLVSIGNGKLLRSLMIAILSEKDTLLQFEACETLLTLISSETAKNMTDHPDLLQQLSYVAAHCSNDLTNVSAAHAVQRLAAHIHVTSRSHEGLLRGLLEMSKSAHPGVLLWTAKAFVQQSTLTGSSFYIPRLPSMLAVLVQLAACPHGDVKRCALEAICNMAEDAANARKLASNASLLGALIDCIECHKESDTVYARRHAVHAILCLANNGSTMRRIAKHMGLVASLSKYGISQDNDVELKRAALHGVLLLAPLL